MKKNVPLTIESITDADEKECRISSPQQIIPVLREIAESGAYAALYYSPKREFIMTTILDLDDDGMWLEQGLTAMENHRITESKRLTLVSSNRQVKVQFVVDSASSVTYDGRPAFFLPMPASLYRLQRRDYFRLSLSTAEHLRCHLNIAKTPEETLPDDAVPLEASVIEVELPAADISGGGIGLICMEGEFDFVPGETYTDCQIELPDIGPIHVSITIKNLISLSRNRTGKVLQRVGCEFMDIDGQTSGKLQRFITNKQRQMAANGLML